jgi:hypothetical protein
MSGPGSAMRAGCAFVTVIPWLRSALSGGLFDGSVPVAGFGLVRVPAEVLPKSDCNRRLFKLH